MNDTSSNNCTGVDDLLKRYYLPVMYTCICIVGVVGNVTALVVYVVKVRPWTNTTIIMCNLHITDLLLMTSLPFLVYNYTLDDTWTLGVDMCRFTRFIFHFNLYGSIFFLTCLAVFRYAAVVHPMHRDSIKKQRWGALACAGVWGGVVALISPIFNSFEFRQENHKTSCPDFASSRSDFMRQYSWVLTALGYLVPLVVVCLCYCRIIGVLKRGPHTGSRERTKAKRVTVLILACFICCFLPYHALRAVRMHTRNTRNCALRRGAHAGYVISRPVAVLNIVFNMLLNTMSRDSFKKHFLELVRCKLGNDAHPAPAIVQHTSNTG